MQGAYIAGYEFYPYNLVEYIYCMRGKEYLVQNFVAFILQLFYFGCCHHMFSH